MRERRFRKASGQLAHWTATAMGAMDLQAGFFVSLSREDSLRAMTVARQPCNAPPPKERGSSVFDRFEYQPYYCLFRILSAKGRLHALPARIVDVETARQEKKG